MNIFFLAMPLIILCSCSSRQLHITCADKSLTLDIPKIHELRYKSSYHIQEYKNRYELLRKDRCDTITFVIGFDPEGVGVKLFFSDSVAKFDEFSHSDADTIFYKEGQWTDSSDVVKYILNCSKKVGDQLAANFVFTGYLWKDRQDVLLKIASSIQWQ